MVKRKVFDGGSTRFWRDKWVDDEGSLASRFPRLYALESHKNALISERWVSDGTVWAPTWVWDRPPRGRAVGEINSLMEIIKHVQLVRGKRDVWWWMIEAEGVFKVRGVYNYLCAARNRRQQGGVAAGKRHVWNSIIPLKINVFMWRAMLHRLPFKNNLISRGITVNDHKCPLCLDAIELDSHVFFSCSKTLGIWKKVFGWWKIRMPQPWGWSSFTALWDGLDDTKLIKKTFHGVCCVVFWAIWSWRNRIVFASDNDGENIRLEDNFPFVQNKSFLWCNARNSKIARSWLLWICNPRV